MDHDKKEMLGVILQKNALVEREEKLTAQRRAISDELDACREEMNALNEKAKEYMKSCVGKCFSCMEEDDDLIWIYEDMGYGLTELRVRKGSNLIRQTRIDNKQTEAFIKSGFAERKGGNNRGVFKHLLYETFQKIENEAGLNGE